MNRTEKVPLKAENETKHEEEKKLVKEVQKPDPVPLKLENEKKHEEQKKVPKPEPIT